MDPYSGQDEANVRWWLATVQWVQADNRKHRWAGYLDNSVGGGIPSGMGAFESLVKESMEEASLEENVVREHVRAVGVVSYFYRTNTGWLQPEVE